MDVNALKDRSTQRNLRVRPMHKNAHVRERHGPSHLSGAEYTNLSSARARPLTVAS